MENARVAKMAEKVAQEEVDEEPLALVDQAIDLMIASVNVINDNLPKIKVQNVPQQAALDIVRETMDEAVAPYLADIVKAMDIFD